LKKSYYDDKIKEDEMGGTCSASGGDEKHIHAQLYIEYLKSTDHLEDTDENRRIILK
jgi:hypothetical protein